MAKKSVCHIKGVYDASPGGAFHAFTIAPVEDLADYSGPIVLGTYDALESRVNLLKNLGIPADRIIVLM